MQRKAGFTLVELSAVILILALLAALVVPSVTAQVGSQRTASFRIDVKRLALQARERAVTTGRQATLRWDGALIAELEAAEEGDDPTQIARLELPDGTSMERATKNGADADLDGWTVIFFPSGRGQSGGLEWSSSGRLFHLTVEAPTGLATVTAGELPQTGPTEWEAGELEQRIAQ